MNRSRNLTWSIASAPENIIILVYLAVTLGYLSVSPFIEMITGFTLFFWFIFTMTLGFSNGRYLINPTMKLPTSDYKLGVLFLTLVSLILILPLSIKLSYDAFVEIIGQTKYIVYFISSIVFGGLLVYTKEYLLKIMGANERETIAPKNVRNNTNDSHLVNIEKNISTKNVLLFILILIFAFFVLIFPAVYFS